MDNTAPDLESLEVAGTRIDPELELHGVFRHIEGSFNLTKLSSEKWPIFAIACLVAGPEPETAAQQLYLYLIRHPPYTTSDARQALVRRLREALMKTIPLIGVCKPIEAITAIAAVERDEDKDYTCTRAGWKCDEANHARAMGWFHKVYTHNADDTMGIFDAHRDFAWVSAEITYGLYLSDRQVLDDIDTELVTLPAIMMQNLKKETHWHIRGTRRIGVSRADVERLWDMVQLVAEHFAVRLDKVPTVGEVEPDV